MPPETRKPRQPSSPELPISVDSVVGVATGRARSDDYIRPELARKGTLPGIPTAPAPRLDAPTLRVSPAGGTPAAPTPDEASQEALRKRAKAAEAKAAELERQARLRAELDSPAAGFPPPVTPAPPKPVEPPKEPEADAVIGWLVKRAVANRKAIYALVAAMGIGGGGVAIKTATEKPQPPPLTMAQLEQALEKQRTRKGGTDDMVRMLNEQLQVTKCLRRKVTQIGESVLPAPDHMGNVRKPQPFEDDCPDSPKPLPEP